MSGIFITAVASASVSLMLVALFATERRRGARFVEPMRARFDRALGSVRSLLARRAAAVNQRFFREIMHYLTHHTLASVLVAVRAAERVVARVVHLNREKARALRRADVSAHLATLSEHKRTVQLSEEEKEARKRDALTGE